VSDEQWEELTTDQKLDWLRSEVERIITHMQRVAAPLSVVGVTVSSLDVRMSDLERMMRALTER
jgi:hypothetical protein